MNYNLFAIAKHVIKQIVKSVRQPVQDKKWQGRDRDDQQVIQQGVQYKQGWRVGLQNYKKQAAANWTIIL